jgi:hypothetical protein
MTTAADDRAVEEAFEASLAGRPVPGEAAGLAAFTSAVRGTATQPGRPNAALAELLSTGLLIDQSSPSTRTAPAAGPLPSRSVRSRTRRRFTMIFSALIAKFLAAGAVAQAATGAGVVVVVVTGAGAAGVLPDAPQQTFDDLTGVNETVDQPADITAPEGGAPVAGGDNLADPAVPPVTQPVAEEPVVAAPQPAEQPELTEEEAAAAAQAAWLVGPVEGQTFGDWVSEGKHKGWATAAIVSNMAHKRNAAAKAAREAARQADDADENENETEVEDADHADEQESEVESTDAGGDRGGHSNSNSSGHGNGNGKGRGGRD